MYLKKITLFLCILLFTSIAAKAQYTMDVGYSIGGAIPFNSALKVYQPGKSFKFTYGFSNYELNKRHRALTSFIYKSNFGMQLIHFSNSKDEYIVTSEDGVEYTHEFGNYAMYMLNYELSGLVTKNETFELFVGVKAGILIPFNNESIYYANGYNDRDWYSWNESDKDVTLILGPVVDFVFPITDKTSFQATSVINIVYDNEDAKPVHFGIYDGKNSPFFTAITFEFGFYHRFDMVDIMRMKNNRRY